MLNFFRKTHNKSFNVQIELVLKICQSLPEKFSNLRKQIQEGIIRDIKILEKPFPNYHKFVLDVNVLNKYEDKKGRSFQVKGIVVWDKSLQNFVPVNIIVAYGLILGYSTPQASELNLDLDKIKITSMSLEFFGENVFDRLKPILSKEELKWVNPSDVYEIELKNTTYYHIKDLDDGDFVAIDIDKNIFKITHDPFEIKKTEENLTDILSTVFDN
jgi:hypothetical protein